MRCMSSSARLASLRLIAWKISDDIRAPQNRRGSRLRWPLEHEFAGVVPRRRSARHSRLAQEGYITRLTHRGYRVSEMTAEEVESVFW
jgi:hypothetical protein